MPLQGQWNRINTPVRKLGLRERRIVIALGVMLVGACVAAVIVAIGTSAPAIPAGCIRIEVPSTTGGGVTQLCDSAARSFCRSTAANTPPLRDTALPKCRQAGYPVAP